MYHRTTPSAAEDKEALDQPPSHSSSNSINHESTDQNVDLEKSPTEPDRLTPLPSHATTTARSHHAPSTRPTSLISRLRSRPVVEPFTHPLAHEQTTRNHLVTFDGPDDPYRPMQWPMHKKILTTILYGLVACGSAFASAVFNAAVPQISAEFHISPVVAVLGTALLLFGLGTGPLLWAPLSEVYGRKIAVLPPYFVAAVFSFATGAAKDVQTVMLTRFFAGFFGSGPITNVGGVIGDIFDPEQRALAIIGYTLSVTGGPTLGPLIGGAIVTHTSWRWIQYTTGLFMLATLVPAALYCDETYAPVLLVRKARRLRVTTANWALHAAFEEWDVSTRELARKFLVRPWQILFTPIALAMNLYAAFVYGVFYMLLGAVPIIFEQGRGWTPVQGGLPFLAVLVGILGGCAVNYANQAHYIRAYRAGGGFPVPEARLPPMMAGGFFFAGGCFITGWTGAPGFPWIAPMVGLACAGLGVITIFQAALNYLIDTFQAYAASAVAANTLLRSLVAGVLPIVVGFMYDGLGVEWATSLIGFIGVGMLGIPFVFWRFGKSLRARGRWSRDSVH